MANKPFAILSPDSGIKQDFPSILLKDAYLPDALDDIKNIWFVDGEIHSIRKRIEEFSETMDDPVIFLEQFWKKDLTWFLVGATKRDIFYRDSTNDRMQFITPKYTTGVVRVEYNSTHIYGGVNVDDCDDSPVAWADGSGGDVTPSLYNDPDGETIFTDSGATGHTITAGVNAQKDSAQKKFGSGSLLLDGASYLSIPDHADWNFGTGNFTIDFQVRFNSIPVGINYCTFYSQEQASTDRFHFYWGENEFVFLRVRTGGSDVLFSSWNSWVPVINTWYHVALVRSGNSFDVYIDGTKLGLTVTNTGTMGDYAAPVFIGIRELPATLPLDGWIDEFRISKGIARWTANFTAPTSAYTSDSYTKLLLHMESDFIKENTGSVKLVVAAGAGVELLAYHNITSINLSSYDSIGFWFYSTVALAAGDLQFLLDDTAACASPLETINFPAITANTWTWVNLNFVTPANLTAIVSIGIQQAVDKGAMTLYIDQIVAGDWVDQLNANDFITIGTTYSTADTWYEISAVTDTHITLTAVYAGATAYQQAYQARKTYTGTATDWWEGVTYDNQFIMTNGVDNMQVWGGTNQMADLSGSPPKLKHIVVYENYIVGGGTSSEPYTYYWCAVGDETNWSTGDSGQGDLDDYYVIQKVCKLGGFLIILTERTIEKLWLFGGDLVFNRKRVTEDCGAWASRSVISVNSAIYFYSVDNTFRCYTGLTWESVSDVFKKYVKDINPEYEKNITGTYIEEHDVLLWAIPDAVSTGNNNQVLIYDLKAPVQIDNWSRFDMQVCTFGFYEVEDTLTWDTWGFSTWDSITWDKWDSRSGQEGAPRELCTDYNGNIFRLFAAETDDGSSYDREFVLATDLTQNKRGISYVKRLTKMRCLFRNENTGTVSVYIKRDYENSWQYIQDISLNGDNEFLFLNIYTNYTAKNFLLKFSATNRFRFLGVIFDEDSYEILGNR